MSKNYLANGRQVNVIQKLDTGYLCEYVYSHEDWGEEARPYSDEVFTVADVYETAPTATYDARVLELRASVDALTTQQRELRERISAVEATERSRFAKFERYKALRQLEDFIEGRITHYVEVPGWGVPRIIEFEQTKNPDGSYQTRDEYKLLTLFGRTNGDLAWKLNRYTDGSGSNTDVIPCTSLDEACRVAQKHITERALGSEDRPREDVINAAEQFNVTLPETYLQKFREARQAQLEKQINEATVKLAQMQADLQALRDPIAENGFQG